MWHFWFKEKMVKFVHMKRKASDKDKSPVVRMDKSLEKYKDKVLFKDKLDKANEMLRTIGLPKSRKHS
jgi:hypothetical protein